MLQVPHTEEEAKRLSVILISDVCRAESHYHLRAHLACQAQRENKIVKYSSEATLVISLRGEPMFLFDLSWQILSSGRGNYTIEHNYLSAHLSSLLRRLHIIKRNQEKGTALMDILQLTKIIIIFIFLFVSNFTQKLSINYQGIVSSY